MAHTSDAVTLWWRGTSLRAKVTGVTVAVLVIGLIAAGIGTMAFLRNTLIANLDEQLRSLAPTDVASGLIDISTPDGVVMFENKTDAPSTQYFVALYDSTGALRAVAGGDGAQEPDFPATFTLQDTATRGLEPFPIVGTDDSGTFHASVDTYQVDNVGELFTQMVALPIASVNQVVASYIGIYSVLAVLILVAGAFATRYLVTFAFRGLGQVESTAGAIAAGDFSLRMTDIEPNTTEVGRLKAAINAMLGRVDTALSQRDATVRQMRRFIGDASHELRTPLVTVRGYAELYRMGAISGDEDTAQAMDRIESEAKRMGFLVEDLLALARLDERRDVVVSPVDLRPVARDAALDLRATSTQRTVTVIDTTANEEPPKPAQSAPGEADVDTDTSAIRRRPATRGGVSLSMLRRKPKPVPATSATGVGEPPVQPLQLASTPSEAGSGPAPIVLGDENRVRQVVTNLLGNARRFTAEDSPIELRVGVDLAAGAGWIEVIDHGEGVPDQIKDKIFQRFWRADTSRARETGGTGLGLSIVASIVEALHGSVSVVDTPGGGATFRVSLPLAAVRDASEHLYLETQPLPRIRQTLADD
ncbi:HAMP domain-containing sensor histidine kinase [Planococcus sp. APC 4015]|nr:HAMP domain-containing sensor histidine kinase [Planococcus sp. APC 4015]